MSHDDETGYDDDNEDPPHPERTPCEACGGDGEVTDEELAEAHIDCPQCQGVGYYEELP